jgi:RHS repeat-associated protein
VQYGYDSASQLTSLTYTKGSTTIGNLTYGYDLTGNRTSMGGSLASVTLPSAVSSASYNAANRLTQWGSSTLAWDANGNLTSDSSKTYTWNARNQLGSMTGATFQYDPFGRRILNAAGHGILYDGVNPVQELSGSTVTANLLTGLGVDEVFTRTDSAGARSFLADALGTTVALTDANGTVQTQYAYGPFGATTTTGAASANSFEFTGRENDGTGLYYYRARYYSPGLQRFVSEDPVDFVGGDANLYGYALSSPTNLVDPNGNCPWCVALGIGALEGGGIDLGIQLLQNGRNIHCVDWKSVGVSALAGAAFSTMGPTGALFGRGGARAAMYGYDETAGLLNRGSTRFGWSFNKAEYADKLSLRIGKIHYDIPGTGIPPGANPIRDGAIAGALGGGATGLLAGNNGCGCRH